MISLINKNLQAKQLIFLLLLFLIPWTFVKSQVTIGSLIPPAKASLLELKNQENQNPASTIDANNISSTQGGLGLPRVALVNKTTLEPFIVTSDSEWIDALTSKIKEKHAGLIVYNIYNSADSETDADKIFQEGTYLWDGQKWELAFRGRKIFPCPAFNLPLSSVSEIGDPDMTFDLYQEYAQQFTKTGNSHFFSNNPTLGVIPNREADKLYEKRELDYVVTYYDESILTINGIDPDGVMSYRVKSVAPAPTAFINIIFVIKE